MVSRTIGVYKSYNFTDKDPVIDQIMTAVKDSGREFKWIEEKSGVRVQTLNSWLLGRTKMPRYASIAAVFSALGYHMEWKQAGRKSINIVPIRRRA